MASAVTLNTITTVMSFTGGVAPGIATGVSVFSWLLLIGLLATTEMLDVYEGKRQKLIRRYLNIGIVPLLIRFTVVIATRALQILG